MRCSRFSFVLFVIAGLIAFGQAVRVAAATRWALLIGVDDYIQAQDLEYCGTDQLALAKQLVACGFPKDQVFVLHDKATDKKYLPFKRNIEKQLELVLGLLERGDVLVVGFSGHGVRLKNESYLCPTDAELGSPDSLVPLKTVYERLKYCRASMKLMMVDACRNDPRPGGRRTFKPAETTRSFARSLSEEPLPEGVVLLNSCAPGEISWEEKDFGHGVFMHYVLEGMKGAADANSDGKVSLGELSRWAGTKTKVYVARKWNNSQRPFLTGEYELGLLDFEFRSSSPAQITNSIGMKLVQVSAGEFLMGSPEGEEDRSDNEYQHRVRITKPFYLGVYEVTQSEYERVMGENPSFFSRNGDGSDRVLGVDTSRFPVEKVSWEDAVKFCEKLSALPAERAAGRVYRLPTEAEWEYACRAGTTTAFHYGNSLSSTQANFDGDYPYGGASEGPDLGRPTPVGSYKPNAWGLYDTHGNVWEWCSDWYDEDYYKSSPVDDPAGPSSVASARVYRGGSWGSFAGYCRSANRFGNSPSFRYYDLGFRVAAGPSGG